VLFPAAISGCAVWWAVSDGGGFWRVFPLFSTTFAIGFWGAWYFGAYPATVAVALCCLHLRHDRPRAGARAPILYLAAVAVTIAWLGWCWVASPPPTSPRLPAVTVANFVWLVAAGLMLRWWRRTPSRLAGCLFYSLFFAGLFTIAMPLDLGPVRSRYPGPTYR
jgi:hypothetical protein